MSLSVMWTFNGGSFDLAMKVKERNAVVLAAAAATLVDQGSPKAKL